MPEEKITKTCGCKCGDIGFQIAGAPVLVEYCHCRSCRHTVGAPLMAWAGFDRSDMTLTHGKPQDYRSSSGVVRSFCGRCGTSLTLADERFPDEVYVSLASLRGQRNPNA